MTSDGRLCELLADVWAPSECLTLAEWITGHVVLPKEVSATPGKYDLDAYPYWRGVIDQAENPETEKLVILAGTQLGKTTLAIALMLALSRVHPAPGMFASPDRDASRELREKVYAIAEASGFGEDLPPARLRNDRWVDLGHARWHSAWAFNTQTLSGKSCRVVFKTELSRWRKRPNFGDPKLIADERVKAFFRSLILEEGTPSDENCSISASYEASDRRRLHVPCPHCNHFQDLRPFPLRKGPYAGFGGVAGVKTADGKWVTPDQALAEAYYLCERGCRIESDQKNAMVREGLWVPKGQHVDSRGRLAGVPLRGPRVAGFRLNALYGQTVTFGRMLSTFIERRGKVATRQTWWNDWAAHKFTARGKSPQWRKLGVKLRGTHAIGTCPPWALFLTAAADPGKGYCRWTVRAWGEGSTSALVTYGTTRNDGRQRLSELTGLVAEILDRDWPLASANALGDTSLRVALLGIDVGYRPRRIHEFWLFLPPDLRRLVRQVAGKAELPDDMPWREKLIKTSKSGTAYAGGGQPRLEISRDIYSAEVHDRWRTPKDEEGAWLLPDVEPGQLEIFLQEIVNEAPVRRPNSRGRMVTRWEKIKSSVGNHYGDCSAYELALADLVVGRNWRDLTERMRLARFNATNKSSTPQRTFTRPDGRAFVATER